MRAFVNKLREVATQGVVHTTAAYLSVIVGVILSMILILIIPGADKTSTFLGRALEAPFWTTEVACSMVAGWYVRRRYAILNAGLCLLIPVSMLVWNIFSEGLSMRKYTPLIDIYFSANSGDTEGLYEFFLTLPVYGALAYCLGALASKVFKSDTRNFRSDRWQHHV